MGMSRIVEQVWVPSASVVPQERGSEFIAPVDGADWSEGVGFHRGFFSSFRIRAGKDVWFHFPIPTSVRRNGEARALAGLSLLWEVLDSARITWLVLQHGGMERIPLTERLAEPPSEPVPFHPPERWRDYYPQSNRRLTEIQLDHPLALRFGIQLSVGVRAADADGTVRFYGAGATFTNAG